MLAADAGPEAVVLWIFAGAEAQDECEQPFGLRFCGEQTGTFSIDDDADDSSHGSSVHTVFTTDLLHSRALRISHI